MTPYTPNQLRDRLRRFSKLELGHFPTPLDECPRLSTALGGPRILMKREDLTGLALGGNKVREFEYWICAPFFEPVDGLISAKDSGGIIGFGMNLE